LTDELERLRTSLSEFEYGVTYEGAAPDGIDIHDALELAKVFHSRLKRVLALRDGDDEQQDGRVRIHRTDATGQTCSPWIYLRNLERALRGEERDDG
jgi:hypothetical protein